MEKNKTVRKGLMITEDQQEYLKQKDFNFSKWVRKNLRKRMKRDPDWVRG